MPWRAVEGVCVCACEGVRLRRHSQQSMAAQAIIQSFANEANIPHYVLAFAHGVARPPSQQHCWPADGVEPPPWQAWTMVSVTQAKACLVSRRWHGPLARLTLGANDTTSLRQAKPGSQADSVMSQPPFGRRCQCLKQAPDARALRDMLAPWHSASRKTKFRFEDGWL